MNKEINVQSSSGNVFADLDLANSDQLLIKVELVRQISHLLTTKNLTQTETAKLLRVDQSQFSALLQGKLSEFSIDRLFRCLNALGSDVEIRVIAKPQSNTQAQTKIVTV